MSFILDALKKSESERQQQSGAEFSNVPSSSGEQQSFKWLWILGLLLLVNIVILLGILLGPARKPDVPAPVQQPAAEPAAPAQEAAPEPTFEERVAEAKQNQPPPQPQSSTAEVVEQPASEPVSQPVAAQPAPASRGRVQTIDELRLNGMLQLPDLHLDIHVYADDPAERFVFINMKKHGEGSQLAEGPVVNEITNDGVILAYRGMTFLLPRE